MIDPSDLVEPHLDKAMVLLAEEGIPYGKLEAETNKDSAEKYGVSTFPTIMWFEYGKNVTRYGRGPTYDAIMMWIYE